MDGAIDRVIFRATDRLLRAHGYADLPIEHLLQDTLESLLGWTPGVDV